MKDGDIHQACTVQVHLVDLGHGDRGLPFFVKITTQTQHEEKLMPFWGRRRWSTKAAD